MKIQKLVLSSFMIAGFVMLCNLRGGATAYAVGLEERMDHLETRLSELTSTQDDHKSAISAIKGLQDRVSLGFGLRTQFSTTEDAAGTKTDGVSGGRSWDKDFDVTNMRLYFGAKVTDNIYVEFNTEISNTSVADDVRLLDAFVEYKWNDYFHIRFGRHLPASDRYNLDGPYYQNSYDFPGPGISAYPFKSTGRAEGVTYWGQYKGGKFKWQLSAVEGKEAVGENNDDPDHLMYTGRLTYNFWEPEPGYYNSSTFYGKKDVLAIGLVGVHQSDGAGTAAKPTDYSAWNVDFLLEKNFGWGTIDIEAGFFDYTNHGTSGGTGSLCGAGQAWKVGFSYLYPEKIGWGYPQFVTRYVSNNPTEADTTAQFTKSKLELALHYIIQEHNAKIALIYSNEHLGSGSGVDVDWNEDRGAVRLGMQLQH
ncbi:hypothetical protein LCGC14_2530940 [marine sediment metagenome]|uniref:Porin domain-containing protein n=1 Tax=marine sediment metagenome TaxID=412755 RepID=A0A0F9ATZ9_9ZZZZ